ncbi:hypothetical protein MBLNU459_g8037t1 [Dothideomycetes sp. NU459]
MGYLTDKLSQYSYRRLPPVYSRDFAYANNAPIVLRMARGNIGGTSATTFADLLSGPTVDFYIGPEKKHWSLHRNLLCHHSPYFETEFLGNEVPKANKKSGEQKLELPDEDPAGFELLVKWLYQGTLEDMSEMTEEKKYDYSVACHKLYMLCDAFDLPTLKNESVDRYRQGLYEAQLVPDAEEINEIYRRSPYGSPFRKLMTQIAARQIMDPDSEKDAASYRKCFEDNPDFAVDMVNAIKAGTGGVLFEDPTNGDQCDYHEHSNGQSCHIKGKDEEYHRWKSQRSMESLQEMEHYPADDESQTSQRSDSTDSDHQSTESNLSGETMVESPTEQVDLAEYLPKVKLEEDQDNPLADKTEAEVKVLQSEDRPLNYVDALRLRRGKARPESRGLWDYWNSKAGVGVK